jgi:hypothetical protein
MLDYFNLQAVPATVHQTSGDATARRRLQRQGKLVIEAGGKMCCPGAVGGPLLIWQRSLDHYSNNKLTLLE